MSKIPWDADSPTGPKPGKKHEKWSKKYKKKYKKLGKQTSKRGKLGYKQVKLIDKKVNRAKRAEADKIDIENIPVAAWDVRRKRKKDVQRVRAKGEEKKAEVEEKNIIYKHREKKIAKIKEKKAKTSAQLKKMKENRPDYTMEDGGYVWPTSDARKRGK